MTPYLIILKYIPGLLYLSTYMDDFQGGRLIFPSLDNGEILDNPNLVVEPLGNRQIKYSSELLLTVCTLTI